MHEKTSASQIDSLQGGATIARTAPPFHRVIDQEKRRWDDLRRGLDPDHQRAFDAVFQRARRHASAAGDQRVLDPFDAILLTMVVELEAELQRVLARLAWLETDDPKENGSLGPRRRHPFEQPFAQHAHPHAPEDAVEDQEEAEQEAA